jgi:hypothetical protein
MAARGRLSFARLRGADHGATRKNEVIMRRLPGPGSVRYVLAAAAVGATLATAACGSQHTGSGSGSQSGDAAQPSAAQCSATAAATAGQMVSLSNKDNGKVLCVRRGTVVAIYLQGSPARRWAPIHSASALLQPAVTGRGMLKLGVTGGFFKATRAGVATVTSSLPSCTGTATSGPHCKMGQVFRLTLVVS